MQIAIRDVTKRFGDFTALEQALLGPSGSGKTTLLRIVAGFDWPDAGEVHFDGEDALSHSVGERQVGFVFQHYALFRHMTVFENIAFGLRVRPRKYRLPDAAIRKRVADLLELVQLGWLAERYPSQLSGGQRQRVALARALAIEPRVLLLDEPFGSLDAKVRRGLRRWLRNLHTELHVTSIFVTHDQEEALEVADRVVVMDKGRIQQTGTPQQVYDHPHTPAVHEFIGESIVVPVIIEAGEVRFNGETLGLDCQGLESGAAQLFARPHDLAIVPSTGEHRLRGVVRRVHGIGPARRVEIALETERTETLIEVDALRAQPLRVGERVGVKPEQYRLFRASV
jgi:sulfate/thiosulfate transport system ATP-binding protein